MAPTGCNKGQGTASWVGKPGYAWADATQKVIHISRNPHPVRKIGIKRGSNE